MDSHLLSELVLLSTLLSASILAAARTNPSSLGDPEAVEFCAAIVTPQGYQCEEHQVTTKDGYILSMHRIPVGRTGGAGGGAGLRRPVLLQHGVMMDGMTWLMNSPHESLAFFLADRGYDVWIANTRGTQWSNRHVKLLQSSPVYWAWSWDELVTYDLPATVNFIYGQTGQKLYYVGHSLGTLIVLASLSEGKMVDKLRAATLLCPVAYLTHMSTPIGILAAKAFIGEIITNILGVAEFNPKGNMVSYFLSSLCRHPGMDCNNLIASITGDNCCLNTSTLDLFLKYEPQPTSTRTMVHFAQTFRDGVLSKYDYGSEVLNMQIYGQPKPPRYNLPSIPNDFPLFLSYGGNDFLSNPQDVEHLLDDLKMHNVDKLSRLFVKNYAHVDFVMGVNTTKTVNTKILKFFSKH